MTSALMVVLIEESRLSMEFSDANLFLVSFSCFNSACKASTSFIIFLFAVNNFSFSSVSTLVLKLEIRNQAL